MRKAILIILSLFITCSYGQAELKTKPSSYDTVSFSNPDQVLINELILTEMGKAKGTTKLCFDSLLFKAAEFHNLYLAQKGDCDHMEADFSWAKTPQDRIRMFINRFDEAYLNNFQLQADGNFIESAEICCNFLLREKITYQDLVKRIINQFKNSPNHWKIITQNMGSKKFFNASSVVIKSTVEGYKVFVVILPNYYNQKYNENPYEIIKVTKQIQEGKWDKLSNDSSFPKKHYLFTKAHYEEMCKEYEKRKRLVN